VKPEKDKLKMEIEFKKLNTMTRKIQLLKNEVTNSNNKLSDLLREVKVLVREIEDRKFLQWVDKELNGYNKNDKIPDYRIVKGEPMGWNPYRGWIPFIHEDPKTQELLSRRAISQSIGELENLVENKEKSNNLQMPYPEEIQAKLSKSVGVTTKFTLFIPSVAVYRILNVARNKLIDWLIELDSGEEIIANSALKINLIFPKELIKKLPKDLKILCDDFNFNFGNNRPIASMLVLRRLLPLSIVRKFQQKGRESKIKDKNGEYFETKKLLGKIEKLLSDKRVYRELINYKILIDSAQHSYSVNIQLSDVEGAAIKIRAFLDEIF